MTQKLNIWKIFAAEVNGQFIEGVSWRSDRAEITYNDYKIIFDNYRLWSGRHSELLTRVSVPIYSEGNFRFEVFRKGIVRNIEKFFGAQDVEIGRQDFDRAFIIKTNNEFNIKNFLQSQEIRDSLLALKEVNIEISDRKGVYEEQLPDKHFELCYYASGEIKDTGQLKSLLKLFKSMLFKLDEMRLISSAHC